MSSAMRLFQYVGEHFILFLGPLSLELSVSAAMTSLLMEYVVYSPNLLRGFSGTLSVLLMLAMMD